MQLIERGDYFCPDRRTVSFAFVGFSICDAPLQMRFVSHNNSFRDALHCMNGGVPFHEVGRSVRPMRRCIRSFVRSADVRQSRR